MQFLVSRLVWKKKKKEIVETFGVIIRESTYKGKQTFYNMNCIRNKLRMQQNAVTGLIFCWEKKKKEKFE